MPIRDGFAVLEWLATQPQIKRRLLVIVISQFADAAQMRRAYDLGADSFLTKPFTREYSENLLRHFGEHWIKG